MKVRILLLTPEKKVRQKDFDYQTDDLYLDSASDLVFLNHAKTVLQTDFDRQYDSIYQFLSQAKMANQSVYLAAGPVWLFYRASGFYELRNKRELITQFALDRYESSNCICKILTAICQSNRLHQTGSLAPARVFVRDLDLYLDFCDPRNSRKKHYLFFSPFSIMWQNEIELFVYQQFLMQLASSYRRQSQFGLNPNNSPLYYVLNRRYQELKMNRAKLIFIQADKINQLIKSKVGENNESYQ